MSEKMNNKSFENGEYLFGMMSFAKDEFIEEMLSDEQAEEIRAANLRSGITAEQGGAVEATEKPAKYSPGRIKIALTACAAVFAVIIGLNVVSGLGKLNGDSTAKDGSAKNTVTATEDNTDGTAAAADKAEETEEAEQDDAAPAEKGEATYGRDDVKTKGILPQQDDAAAENDGDTHLAEQELRGTSDTLVIKADNGTSYCLLDAVSVSHKGEKITSYEYYSNSQDAERSVLDIYRFDDFEPDTFAMIKTIDGGYRLMVKYDLEPETVDDIYSGFRFEELLNCDSWEFDGNITETTTEDFRRDFMDVLFANPAEMTAIDSYKNSSDRKTIFHCWLGKDDERYIDVDITLYESGRLCIEMAGMKYYFMADDPGNVFD